MSHISPTLSRRSLFAIATALGGGALIGARAGFAGQPEPAHKPTQATPTTGSSTADSGFVLDRALDPGTGIVDTPVSIASFADLDAETAALGLERPGAGADEREITRWLRSMTGLAFPRDVAYFLTEEWTLSTGFSMTDVSQTAEIGDPPDVVTLWAGTFDRAHVIETWTTAGYTKIEDDGNIAIYSLSEDASFDLENPVQRVFLARRNNVAIVGSDLVISTSTLDLLRRALDTATGEGTPVSQAPGPAALFANSPALASGMILSGSIVLPDPNLGGRDDIATPIAETQSGEPMPPVLLVLAGVTPGGPIPVLKPSDDSTPIPTPETARLAISLLFLANDQAEAAAQRIDTNLQSAFSLRTGRPFTDFFDSWDISVSETDPVTTVLIDLKNVFPKIWMDLVFSRDLPFLS